MKNDNPTAYHQGLTRQGKDNDTVLENGTTAAVTDSSARENPTGSKPPAEDIPIEKGATLLHLYKVESDPIVGGMGRVFRVRHTGWNTDLAMKQPKRELFRNEAEKQAFIHECDAWINLGLHPHIVSCYYVREIGGIPSIFSEWMDGGSLKGFINGGALYEGSDKTALERILDISIQFARGLHYAHEQQLIHQDVKPDNLLLSKTGEAKVADFGIANARTMLGAENESASSGTGTIISGSGGYTPAYCSPEQAGGRELTRRTDIWSWAVSVLEMFTGERYWNNGTVAGRACEDYFDMARIPVPEAMKDLLRHCFKENEAERPHDFKEIETVLLQVYRDSTGKAYDRVEPKTAADTADSLNNKALSYLDLGKPEEAEKCWKEALAIDSSHADSLYNRSVHLWKNAKIDDLEAIRLLESGGKNYDCLLARLHLIRGDAETALEYLDKIAETSGETDEIKNLRAMAGKIIEERLVRTLGNRTSYETGLFDFNPDSNRVAIAYKVAEEAVDYIGWQIQLWDIVTGEMIASVHSSMKYPYSLKISPDGNKVLFIGRETEIEIWDIPEGNCIYTKDSCFICRTYVCFNSTGKMALWGDDRGISLWNVDTGTCIWEFKDNVNIKHYRVLCFSPDDSRALSCDYKTVHLWNIATGECIATLPCNASANAVAFAFSPDNNLVFIIGYDGTMQLWDIVTGTCARTRTSARKTYKHTFASNYFTGFDPENDRAIYEGKLWDTITGRCIRTYERAKTPFYFIPGGTKLIFHDMDGIKICRIPRITEDNGMIISQIHSTLEVTEQATLFDLLAGEIDRLVSNKDIATALIKLEELRNIRTFGSNEAYLAATRKLFPYCVSGKIREQYLKACVKTVSYLCFNPAGNQLIINQYTGDVSRSIFLDANTGQCVRTFDVKGHVIHFCFSPDGSKVLICSRGPYLVSSIHLWDTVTGEYIRTFPHNNNHIRTTFSPDGHKIVSESGSYRHYSVDVWDVADKKRLYTFRSNALHGSIVQLSPCGTKAIIKGSKLIDVSTGKCIGKLVLCPDKKLKMISDPEELKNIPDTEFNASFVGRHRFSPDGNRILIEYCIRSELEMKLWDIKAMKYVQTFHVPYNNFYTSHFSPDGSKILGVTDQKLWLWDTHTGECLCSIDHQTESHNKSTKDYYINSFSLTLDNSKVLLTKHKSLYEGYQLSLWDIRTGECLLTRENVTKDCGLSPDGKTLVFTSGDNLYLYELEYELHFPGQEHRDEDAQASKRIKAKIEEIIMKDLVITMKNGFPEQK